MTWLEEERAQRERVWNAVERLNVALEKQSATFEIAFEKQNTVFATALEKQNTAIERQNTAIERQNTALEKALKEQTRFYFLAWAVQLAAIVGLYAR